MDVAPVDVAWTERHGCSVDDFHTKRNWSRTLSVDVSQFAQREDVRLVSRMTLVQFCVGSPLSSKFVVCGDCLLTLSITINQILK